MQGYKTIEDLGNLNGKVVMLRADLNVPMDENFHVTNTARIDRTVPTIKLLMEKGAKVVVISHFGRPEGKGDVKNSLSHVAPELEKALGKHVVFVDDCIGEKVADAVKAMKRKKAMKPGLQNWLNQLMFMFLTLSQRLTVLTLLLWLPLNCVRLQWAC